MERVALACVELTSIARGVRVLDAMVKRAPVRLRHYGRHSDGKFVILIDGDVASVEEAYEEGLQHAGSRLLDHMMLPRAHDRLVAALAGELPAPSSDALLMVETSAVACLLEAVDHTLKLIATEIVDLHVAQGIGGKGYVALEGALHDLEYARDELAIRLPERFLVELELIARPHADLEVAFGQDEPLRAAGPTRRDPDA